MNLLYKKVTVCAILILMVSTSSVKSYPKSMNGSGDNTEIVIKVAIYTDETEDEDFYSPFRRTCYFVYALRDYSWKVGNITYRFDLDLITSEQLYNGILSTTKYNAIIYPPDQSWERSEKEHEMERVSIGNFIDEGGGYFGTCAGGLVFGHMQNEPETSVEKSMNIRMLHLSPINVSFKAAYPLFCELMGYNARRVGPSYEYCWCTGFNQSDYDINYHGGVCQDYLIFKDNAIFDDYIGDTRRMRWIGGPPLIIPAKTDREIKVLARFPEEEISENESTQIHYWTYTGGFSGLLSSILKAGVIHYQFFNGILQNFFIFGGDWKPTTMIVETDFSNKPIMTTEIYPNENKARIVRCLAHPEHNVWWGGHLEDREDIEYNNIYEGFHIWKDIPLENETIINEWTYNYWILRRCVAWASKIPDEHLPPIYGSSEVKDIMPYDQNQKMGFILEGISELSEDKGKHSDGIVTLDLYYRYSEDNSSWSEWQFYKKDINELDGWSWQFNPFDLNGFGYYQFCSISQINHEYYIENEKFPPGPDACVSIFDNERPDTPSLKGPENGKKGELFTYYISTSDPDQDNVFYLVDWGDGSITDWFGPYPTDIEQKVIHSWDNEGQYNIMVKSKDIHGTESDWTNIIMMVAKQKARKL